MLRSVEAYQHAIMEIKIGLNALTPIGRLPPELLAGIMLIIVRDYYDYMDNHALHWIKVTTTVCRSWRCLALDTPVLWGYITLDMVSEHFAGFIARSKRAPLFVKTFVSVNDTRSAAVKQAVHALVRESARLQELQLQAPVRLLRVVCGRMTCPAPKLRSLVLVAGNRDFDTKPTASETPTLIATPGSLPNLRHLEIRDIPIMWQDAIFINPSVTSLTVILPPALASRIRRGQLNVGTFEELLLALEQLAPSLQSLTLEGSIPLSTTDTTDVSPSTRMISFSSLRSIQLVGDTHCCASLLRHMSMPSIGSVNVRGYGNDGVAEVAQRLSEDFSRMEPWQAAELKSSANSVDLTAWTGDVTYFERQPVILTFEASTSINTSLLAILSQAHVWFKSLRRLVMKGSYHSLKWADLFVALPQLRELYIDSDPPPSFFVALRPKSRPNIQAPLPHLRIIELGYVMFHPLPYQRRIPMTDNTSVEFFPAFLKTLKLRASARFPLTEVHIKSCIRVQPADVKALKQVVPNVKWDAQEDMHDPSEDSGSDSDSDAYDGDGMSIQGNAGLDSEDSDEE